MDTMVGQFGKRWMILFVFILTCSKTCAVKIGIICNTDPKSWQYLFNVASAINIAKDRLVEEGVIANDTIDR